MRLGEPDRALAAPALLVDDDHDEQVAAGGAPALACERDRRDDLGGRLRLHVDRAAAPDLAVDLLARPRVLPPVLGGGEDGVDVRQQAEDRALGAAAQAGDEVGSLLGPPEQRDLEPGVAQQAGQHLLGRTLGARWIDGSVADELAEQRDRLLLEAGHRRKGTFRAVAVPALALSAVRKRYGRTEALAGVDLEVGEGELVGLLGPNGAGQVDAHEDRLRPRAPERGHRDGVRSPRRQRAGARRDRLPRGAVPLPRLGDRGRAARAAPAPRTVRRRRGRARRAARARRPRGGDRAAGRGDVEGHAAAARDRPGAHRRAAARPARRAHERAGSRRAAARPRHPRGPARAGHRGAAELAPAQRGRARLRPCGHHRPRPRRSPRARPRR